MSLDSLVTVSGAFFQTGYIGTQTTSEPSHTVAICSYQCSLFLRQMCFYTTFLPFGILPEPGKDQQILGAAEALLEN